MAISNIVRVLALAAALAALSGCTLYDQEGNYIGTSDKITPQPLTVPKYADPGQEICKEVAGDRPCYCMACQNKSSHRGFWAWLGGYYDNTLSGGNCSIAACNIEDYYGMVEDNGNVQMRTFALGAGQSFVSSGIAGQYCNYSLQFATKWMKGGEGAPPRVPQASRAACWLERSMLPIFIYYTGGKAIDPARTAQIAKAFNDADVGPAIITTEAVWDGSDTSSAALVRQQILAMDACDKCLKVLAIRQNDYSALYNVLGMPGNIDKSIYDRVDAVGFGFRANDYPQCNIDRIIYENSNFSRYILAKYGKPTIWLYFGASEGNSSIGNYSDGGCDWTANKVQDFYSEIMARAGGLASNGVLGMSAYEFVDRTGPLPCNGVQGCDFGMLLANGSQKHPELNGWSEMCQVLNVESVARRPLIFSQNGQGSACGESEFRFTDQALMQGAARISSSQGVMDGAVWATAKIKNLGCGEACPGNGTSMPRPSTYDGTSNGFDGRHCMLYPIIDERADDDDVSASYMRAIIEQESGFDPYAVSNASLGNAGCNPDNLPIEKICEYAGVPPDKCPAFAKDGKPCAYGLAQCIEYPGQYYVKNGMAVPDEIKDCGAGNYNPFDPGMSVCCGAKKFGDYLRTGSGMTAEKWVGNNWAELSKCQPGGMKDEEKGWAAYYIASNMYYGTVWNMLSQFISQRDSGGSCTGTLHYIDYLRSINAGPAPGTSYGAQVMSRYRAAVSACNSDCPA